MKKILLLLALSTPAFASASEPVPMKETCSSIAEVARVTMLARQVGVPMRQLLAPAEDSTLIDIITEAYGHPAYRTPKNQDRAIQEFEDQWYLKCVKSYNL